MGPGGNISPRAAVGAGFCDDARTRGCKIPAWRFAKWQIALAGASDGGEGIGGSSIVSVVWQRAEPPTRRILAANIVGTLSAECHFGG